MTLWGHQIGQLWQVTYVFDTNCHPQFQRLYWEGEESYNGNFEMFKLVPRGAF